MRRLLQLALTLLLLAVPVVAEEQGIPFQPADRSFRVYLPAPAQAVEQSEARCLWGCEVGRTSYMFGYSVVPRAATMAEPDLRGALDDFLTSYFASAGVHEKERTPTTVAGHPGVDGNGIGTHGRHWARVFSVGPRVYVVTAQGTTPEQTQRYFKSFQVLPSQ